MYLWTCVGVHKALCTFTYTIEFFLSMGNCISFSSLKTKQMEENALKFYGLYSFDQLLIRVSSLQLTGDVHDEVENHNRLLDRMV